MILRVILSSAGTLGVVGGVASLTLWQKGQFGGNSVTVAETASSEALGASTNQSTLPSSQATVRINQNTGNCVVIDDTIDKSIFGTLNIQEDEYVAVSCKKINLEDSEINFADSWKGLFPSELLANTHTLTEGKRFDIKTKTDEEGDVDFKTTFTGNRFLYGTVIGKWNRETRATLGDSSIKEIKVQDEREDFPSIYLLSSSKE